MSKNPENWWKYLMLKKKIFISPERLEEFKWNFQVILKYDNIKSHKKNRVLNSVSLENTFSEKPDCRAGQIDPSSHPPPPFLGLKHFSYLLTRKMSKTKGKNPYKMCQLISLKICPQQQK